MPQPYPTIITPEILEGVAHIRGDIIKQDIIDTQAEIDKLEVERDAHAMIAKANMGTPKGKLANLRATAKRNGIERRQAFITFLRAILEGRTCTESA